VDIIPLKKTKNKNISYLRAYSKGFMEVLRCDFLYIFYPNSFRYLALFAYILRKPYGLYVRGEQGVNSKFSKWAFKHAQFVTTISPSFSDKILAYNDTVFTIRPMIPFNSEDIITDRIYLKNDRLNILFVGRIERDK